MNLCDRLKQQLEGNEIICTMCNWIGKESSLEVCGELEMCPKCKNAEHIRNLDEV